MDSRRLALTLDRFPVLLDLRIANLLCPRLGLGFFPNGFFLQLGFRLVSHIQLLDLGAVELFGRR